MVRDEARFGREREGGRVDQRETSNAGGGVENQDVVAGRPGVEEAEAVGAALEDARLGRKLPPKPPRGEEARGVVATRRVPEAEDDGPAESARQLLTTWSFRKCVAHEMHGS